MAKEYTYRINNFQFRSPVYLDGREPDPRTYDLVKWEQHEPYEVTDWHTGEKRMSSESCFSIGRLKWDYKNDCFDFESCGLRYLEERTEWLEEWILAFAAFKETEFMFLKYHEEEEEEEELPW